MNCQKINLSNIHVNKLLILAFLLTCSPKEEKHSDPVDPEEHEAEEGPERLQGQQGKMDEHFTSHMEQGNSESHTLPHEENHQQENYLEGYKSFLVC